MQEAGGGKKYPSTTSTVTRSMQPTSKLPSCSFHKFIFKFRLLQRKSNNKNTFRFY